MTDRDGDDNYGETTMDEPRDFSTWVGPDEEPAVSPAARHDRATPAVRHDAAPAPNAAPAPEAAGPLALTGPPQGSYGATMPLPATERGGIAPPTKFGPTEPLPAGVTPGRRLDFGPTELDDPVDLRSTSTPARRDAPRAPPVPPADTGSDTGLKILLAALVVLIVVLLIAMVVGIASSFGNDPEEDESAETESA